MPYLYARGHNNTGDLAAINPQPASPRMQFGEFEVSSLGLPVGQGKQFILFTYSSLTQEELNDLFDDFSLSDLVRKQDCTVRFPNDRGDLITRNGVIQYPRNPGDMKKDLVYWKPVVFPVVNLKPVFLLQDDYLVDGSGPLATDRVAEPGPGVLYLVQTDGNLSVVNKKLVFPAQSTPAWGDQGFWEPLGRSRVAGRALITQATLTTLGATGVIHATWFSSSAMNAAATTNQSASIASDATAVYAQELGLALTATALATATSYQFAVVLREVGAFYFIKGGIYTAWTLLFVSDLGSTATVYPGFSNYNAAGTKDYFYARDLEGHFTTDKGIATLDKATPSGSYYGESDLVGVLTFALPGGPSANQVGAELRYRYVDSANYWSAYVKRNAGNSDWDLYLDKVTGGVAATQSGFPVTSIGNATDIEIRALGALHNVWTKTGSTWTKRGGQISSASFQGQKRVAVVAGTGATLSALAVYPATSAVYEASLA